MSATGSDTARSAELHYGTYCTVVWLHIKRFCTVAALQVTQSISVVFYFLDTSGNVNRLDCRCYRGLYRSETLHFVIFFFFF